LHEIPPLLACINQIDLAIPVMSGCTVPIDPVWFACAVSTVHFQGLSFIGYRVIESHMDEEMAQYAQDSFPLSGGKPRPFETVNLVLVSPNSLTHDCSVSVTPGIYDCGYDNAHTSFARW
jgi:hypothetical protein